MTTNENFSESEIAEIRRIRAEQAAAAQIEQPISEALDNVPAVYRVPASKASLHQNQFRFQLPGEDHIRSIPKLKYLKPKIAVQVEGMPVQQALQLLFSLYEPGLIDEFDDMEQLEGVIKAWADASGVSLGGIEALLELLREHRGAIEFTLLSMGKKLDWLGSDDLDWRELWMIISHTQMGSALAESIHGEQSRWKVTDYLLAMVADALHDANWQRGGGKGAQPERVKRPGVKDKSTQSFGSEPIKISEFNDWWAGD
ncbi:tail assembly chaperone [Arthrobacter phage Nancia]|nr:tail assembly chaperone [Arthrobacter phage DrRobert]AOQ28286.1 tail assembly chaperone [Arthrobacter phage Lucy]ASR83397.1 tail assembly chaperone [Arthrobacter phage Christian]AZS06995.1 tail assembly chaperone [Arthrobacter phage ChewChew]AZS07270.1 tail assembly chaperone [Arthrobacter phage CristinaYang]AZS08511.1 tail assembly chaperone [Arthrobacter phage Lasagna]AZS08673.1 tail assembly chaperone [Arthrobacter phage Lennox]AZS09100.1 tail assembly chaperone [Arthrobacter phage Nan